jgi:hypothetical protein
MWLDGLKNMDGMLSARVVLVLARLMHVQI